MRGRCRGEVPCLDRQVLRHGAQTVTHKIVHLNEWAACVVDNDREQVVDGTKASSTRAHAYTYRCSAGTVRTFTASMVKSASLRLYFFTASAELVRGASGVDSGVCRCERDRGAPRAH